MRWITTWSLCLLVLACGGPGLDKGVAKATATGEPSPFAPGKGALAETSPSVTPEAPAAIEVPRPEARPRIAAAPAPRPTRAATLATTVAAPEPARAVAAVAPSPPPTAERAPEPVPPAPAIPAAPSEVVLARAVVSRAIEDREPVGEGPFANDVGELFLFLDARNDGAPATLQVRWDAPDGTRGRAIELAVPTARRWRTWATTNRIRGHAGTWTVVVTDASGREITRQAFSVEGAPSS